MIGEEEIGIPREERRGEMHRFVVIKILKEMTATQEGGGQWRTGGEAIQES